jgi:hypothetical protein
MTASTRHAPPAEAGPPSAGRAIGLLIASLAAGLILLRIPTAGPPSGVDGFLPWWAHVGTPDATMVILRGIGIATAASTVVLAALGLAVALSPARTLLRLWARVAPTAIRQLIAASALVGSTLASTVAGAVETERPPVLVDLGADGSAATAASLPILRDLGPADREHREPAPTDAERAAAESAATWIVEPGDHLWRIAAETVAARGAEPRDAVVAPYWRRLITANREVIGDDADLIHPGDVLTLPE